MPPMKRERSPSPPRSRTPPMPKLISKPTSSTAETPTTYTAVPPQTVLPQTPPPSLEDPHAADRMASIHMNEMLDAENVLHAQLQKTAAEHSLPKKMPAPADKVDMRPNIHQNVAQTSHIASDLFQTLSTDNLFIPWEKLLFAACDCTLSSAGIDLQRIAQAIKASRITLEQITAHAQEIGVDKDLRITMIRKIHAFVQFMLTVEKLDIIKFEDPLQNRSLLGFKTIKILHQKHWENVIAFACDEGCFGAKSSIYEMLLRFGYGVVIGSKSRKNLKPGNSTDKKNEVLLYTNPLVFNQERLEGNLKRYTNGQSKPKQNSLLVLANVAQKSSTAI